jgi:hypothetical protein
VVMLPPRYLGGNSLAFFKIAITLYPREVRRHPSFALRTI